MKPVIAQPRGNKENGGYKVNMVELNSNSFRLDSSLSIANSITFSSNWWLDSGANIYICMDHSCFKSYHKQHERSVSLADDSTREIKVIEHIDLRMTLEKVLTLQDICS